MYQWISNKRGKASKSTKLAIGFFVGMLCGVLLFCLGVPQLAINGATIGIAAGVAYSI